MIAITEHAGQKDTSWLYGSNINLFNILLYAQIAEEPCSETLTVGKAIIQV